MASEQQRQHLEKQLAEQYLRISASYKQMSKVKDKLSLDIMQAGVEQTLKQVNELRIKLHTLQMDLVNNWNKTGPNKSPTIKMKRRP